LAKAAREAREAFGDDAQHQLANTLQIVEHTANDLGIEVGTNIRAMLDAHSVSFSGGAIAPHSENGVPLRGLGTGSARLLIAGLQRKAAAYSTILLIDETEHGLEPHRIIWFLASLGAKESAPPLQVFMTTHSPVVVRELSGNQLSVVRKGDSHRSSRRSRRRSSEHGSALSGGLSCALDVHLRGSERGRAHSRPQPAPLRQWPIHPSMRRVSL
jgi:hypothetical protein